MDIVIAVGKKFYKALTRFIKTSRSKAYFFLNLR